MCSPVLEGVLEQRVVSMGKTCLCYFLISNACLRKFEMVMVGVEK